VPDESHDPVMQALMRSTGAVLELPIAGPGSHAAAMYRAIAHRHPLLNGYSGYWPREFEQRIELACRLPDVTALRQLARETDVELILVNRHGWGRPGARPPNECPRALKGATRWQTWQRLARTGHPALTLVARQDDRLLFRVQPDSHM
jgi:hypothetical protein